MCCTTTCITVSLIIAAVIYYLKFIRTKPKLDIPSRDRVIVVSGAAGGFGSAICKDLLSRFNARVIGLDISKEVMEKVYSEELKTYGSKKLALIECNICKLEECEKAKERIDEILKEWKAESVFALVNNAGVSNSPKCVERVGIVEYPEEELLDVFGSNLFGHVRMTRLLYPLMKESKDEHRGAIINVASIAGLVAGGFFGFYASSKFAMVGFTDSLRREMKGIGKKGLRVTCIEPGFSKTAILNLKPQSQNSEFGRVGAAKEKRAASVLRNAQPPKVVGDAICEQIFSSNNLPHVIIDYWYMKIAYMFLYYTGLDM